MKKLFVSLVFIITIISHLSVMAQALGTNPEEGKGTYKNRTFFNLERYWDSSKILNNPHKGWEVHYYSNHLRNYGSRLSPDDSLSDFPGLSNIYMRLAWSFIEPEEGVYNWSVIDSVVNRWVARGKTVSFRITTKETTFVYATPEWVRKAGAKGKFIENSGLRVKAWAPDYGDEIFLEKLENFHKAFAARYCVKPYVAYVDIGSVGEWGEGHTAYSGWEDVPVEVIKKHLDIYKRQYKNTVLVISDDFIGQRDADDDADYEIFYYCLKNGIGFRDDSANVGWYRTLGFGPSCIRSPELFNSVYKTIPVVLENDHYRDAVRRDMFGDGSGFEQAVRETKATIIGFHHFPREWLNENYRYAIRVANLSGYWYFPKFAMLPDTLRTNSDRNYIRMTWENQGVAPAYNKYDFSIRLINKKTRAQFDQTLAESDNRKWLPNEIVAEHCIINLDKNLEEGNYDLLINLRNTTEFNKDKNIELPIISAREIVPGWYKLGEIWVK
jgi:Beta-galactosidase.